MIRFTDRAPVGRVKEIKGGYLVATARVARTGVQEYLASEIGDVAVAAGFGESDVVRVYRHADQVFSADTLASVTRVPVTVGHPDVMVDASNWSKYAVGEVGDAYSTEPEWIVVNPMVKDSAAIQAARTTHQEISMGYEANIVKARDGVDADFEMVDIRMNHLALVPRGRAGSEARIGDSANWGATPRTVKDDAMTIEVKTVILGDKAVEVVAKDADTVAAILKDHTAAIGLKDKEIGELTVKLSAAEAKVLSDADLAKLVDAKVKANTERAAVKAKIGDKADAMTDAQIEGAFLALDGVPMSDDKVRDILKDKKVVVGDEAEYEARVAAAQAKHYKKEAK